MTAALTSPAGFANAALIKIGSKRRVGSLLDGSVESETLLKVYGQTRDELIREGEWEFAERSINANLLKQAPPDYITTPWTPAFPCLPWLFEYSYPADALKVRAVKRQPIVTGPNFDPRYNAFSIDNDNTYTPNQRVVLCDVPQAIMVYAAQVTDPTNWDVDFGAALIDALGEKIAAALSNMDAAKMEAQAEQARYAIADEQKG